jgi:CDP-diacylglycerol--glycerol-3-phosphate 3-phosphatidyltransferase
LTSGIGGLSPVLVGPNYETGWSGASTTDITIVYMASRSRLRSIPNIISLSRVILALAFVMQHDPNVRIGIVIAAAVTDMLDGRLARRAGLVSRFGALVDPFADRVFVLVAVAAFVYEGTLDTWQYFIMISRDLMTAVGFLVARSVQWLRPVEFRARMSGKIVTSLQLVSFAAMLKAPKTVNTMIWIVGIASLYSIADYTWALWESSERGAAKS